MKVGKTDFKSTRVRVITLTLSNINLNLTK